jgi:hypothetical protein
MNIYTFNIICKINIMNFEFEDIKDMFDTKSPSKEWEELKINNYRGGVKTLNKLKLWEWIRTYQPTGGFCYSNCYNVNKIMIEIDGDGHTGASFGCMMRGLQKVACDLIPETECDNETCAICLEKDYNKKIVLECCHKFHLLCISQINDVCPLCRGLTVPKYLKAKETNSNNNKYQKKI